MDATARGIANRAQTLSQRLQTRSPIVVVGKHGFLGGDQNGSLDYGGGTPGAGGGTCTAATGRTRLYFTAAGAVQGLRMAFTNWRVGGPEQNGNNDITLKASVEYAGAVYPLWFGGQRTVTIQPGATVWCDWLGLTVAASGSAFVRCFTSVASTGMSWPIGRVRNTVIGEGSNIAAGGAQPDLTDSTSWPTNNTGNIYGPSVIIGYPEVPGPAVYIAGDSIAFGTGDNSGGDAQGCQGYIERALADKLPWCAGTRLGDLVGNFVSSNYKRMGAVTPYVTHCIMEYGRNDLSGGSTLATIQANLLAAWNIFSKRGIKVFQTTITPRTNSTDSWATTANQTLNTSGTEAIRVQLNDWIRTVPAPLTGYFEIADIAETARNSGIWKATGSASGYTADGLHPTGAMHALLAAGIDVTRLTL